MRILSKLFRMFSNSRGRGTTGRSAGRGGAMTSTRGGGLMSKVRRFLR